MEWSNRSQLERNLENTMQSHSPSFKKQIKAFIPQSYYSLKQGYSFHDFLKDIIAGLSVAAIAFPIAIAIAIGANISPIKGVYTAIVAGFLISLLGGSKVQIGGPTSTLIVVLSGIMLTHGYEGILLATMMAGVILIIFGFAGFGTYIKYIPYPVVTGLTTGIAVVIFSSQFKDFFGIKLQNVPIDFLGKWQMYWKNISTIDPLTALIAILSLLGLIYLRKRHPKLPGTLIVLTGAAFVTTLFNLNIETIASKYGILSSALPFPAFPTIQFKVLLDLIPDALTIALLCGIESLLAAVVAEGMTGWRHQTNTELIAQGFANIGISLFGGLPASGSLSRTAANIKGGAKTPIAGMIHAVFVFLILFLFGPLVGKLPLCSLSAVLFMVAWNMSEIHHFLHLFTAPKKDIVVLITVFSLTVLVNITAAVQIGMILAAFLFMKQMSDISDVVSIAQYFKSKDIESLPDPDAINQDEVPAGVEIYEINGPFFFGVADRLKNLLNELQKPPHIFILRMRKVPTIDASGMHALEEFFLECRRQHTTLLLSGIKKNPLKDLKRYQLDKLIGEEHIFSHIDLALAHAREIMRRKESTV